MIISGIVESGKHLGRTIGFPTANILPDGAGERPENGVYLAAAWLEGESGPRPCMVNMGRHPTVPDGKPTIEAHILNFGEDIYGKRVRLEVLEFLRPEKRFESIEALRAQLETDRAATLAWALGSSAEYPWLGL